MKTRILKATFSIAALLMLALFCQKTQAELVAHYTLDEIAGTAAADSAPDGVDHGGILLNGLEFGTNSVAGILDNSLMFDGTDDRVRLEGGGAVQTDTTALALTNWTLATWFQKSGDGSGNQDHGGGGLQGMALIAKGTGESDNAGNDTNYLMGLHKSNGSWYVGGDYEAAASGANHLVYGTTAIEDDTWYHATLTYDGNDLNVYLYGVLENTLETTDLPATVTGQVAGLGAGINSGGGIRGAFEGLLDDARIYDSVLTSQEIADLVSNTSAGDPPVSTWKVNAMGDWSAGGNWIGVVPNSNQNIVILGGAITADRTVATDTNVTIRGIEFDNANSYVVAGAGTLNLEDGFDFDPPEAYQSTINVAQGSHQFQLSVALGTNTEVTIADGATLTFNGALNKNGYSMTQKGDGTLVVNNIVATGGGALIAAEGMLAGTGMIGGNLTIGNTFIYAINDEGGLPLVVEGQLTLAPWTLELTGDNLTGTITTDMEFPVFEFGTLTTGNLPAGIEDINGDGQVGGADLNLVLSQLGASGVGDNPADLNDDGNIDQGDLDLLLAAFGEGAAGGSPTDPYNASIALGSGTSGWDTTGWDLVVNGNQLMLTGISSTGGGDSQSVPEPTSIVLMLFGVIGLLAVRRRQ